MGPPSCGAAAAGKPVRVAGAASAARSVNAVVVTRQKKIHW